MFIFALLCSASKGLRPSQNVCGIAKKCKDKNLKLMNHEIAMRGNVTLFHRAKSIEKILIKDEYLHRQ